MRAKIIYYGPAAGGKTTNLVVLHRHADPKRRGEMVSVNSTQDRTILLDLLPIKTPAFRSYELRFQVIAVPGQRLYAASRKLLLNGADCVVFVANSAADRWEETLQSLREMNQHLLSHGLDPSTIPVVFQYNKRDLPDLTPFEAMDRTLNARRSDSFSAVAIQEEGVLDTFAAALLRTMKDLTTRYKIGESLSGARSVKEWTEETMRAIFGWKRFAPERDPEPLVAPRMAVRVPVAESATPLTAAATMTDPQAAESLVESYAEAATHLTSALDDIREERDQATKRIEELSAPVDAARELLAGEAADGVLRKVLLRVGHSLGTDKGTLSLVRPDGELELVVASGLTGEPLLKSFDPDGAPVAATILKRGVPVVFLAGDEGPLGPVLPLAGENVSALVAIPVATPVRSLGLLAYYLSPEAIPPHPDSMTHLARIGQGLALALEVASGAIASERLERAQRTALVGHVAERAMVELGGPLDRLFSAIGRIRGRRDGPSWLLEELLGLGTDLVRTKSLRDCVHAFTANKPSPGGVTSLDELFDQVRGELAPRLEKAGVALEIDHRSDGVSVSADPFLLRSALLALIERSLESLDGLYGGRIGIRVDSPAGAVRITLFDNGAALKREKDSGPLRQGFGGQRPASPELLGKSGAKAGPAPDCLAWSLDRKVSAFDLMMVKAIVEHLRGTWHFDRPPGKGSQVTITLPRG